MWETLKTVLLDVITFVGQVLSALFGTPADGAESYVGAWAEIQEFAVLGIAISVILVATKIYRKVCWGS